MHRLVRIAFNAISTLHGTSRRWSGFRNRPCRPGQRPQIFPAEVPQILVIVAPRRLYQHPTTTRKRPRDHHVVLLTMQQLQHVSPTFSGRWHRLAETCHPVRTNFGTPLLRFQAAYHMYEQDALGAVWDHLMMSWNPHVSHRHLEAAEWVSSQPVGPTNSHVQRACILSSSASHGHYRESCRSKTTCSTITIRKVPFGCLA